MLGAVGDKLIMLIQATLSNPTIEVKSTKTLLYITSNRSPFLPTVYTGKLPGSLNFSHNFTVFRGNISVENPRRELYAEKVAV